MPPDLDSAYRVQRQVHALGGAPLAGYKVGMTNATVQQAFGLAEPIVGRLAPGSVLHSGCTLPGAATRMRWVESEVIFRMAADAPPLRKGAARELILPAVGAAHAGLEVCDSRFADFDAQPTLNVVADNSNASVIVLGGEIPIASPTLEVTLACGPAPAVIGSTAAVQGDPLGSLCWLAHWLQQRGENLLESQYVATGTCTGVTTAGPGDRCSARFGDLASVECIFVP